MHFIKKDKLDIDKLNNIFFRELYMTHVSIKNTKKFYDSYSSDESELEEDSWKVVFHLLINNKI